MTYILKRNFHSYITSVTTVVVCIIINVQPVQIVSASANRRKKN